MAVLAKPINRIAVIKKQESQEFVRDFNKNKVTEDFLDSCRKAGKLFGKRKWYCVADTTSMETMHFEEPVLLTNQQYLSMNPQTICILVGK